MSVATGWGGHIDEARRFTPEEYALLRAGLKDRTQLLMGEWPMPPYPNYTIEPALWRQTDDPRRLAAGLPEADDRRVRPGRFRMLATEIFRRLPLAPRVINEQFANELAGATWLDAALPSHWWEAEHAVAQTPAARRLLLYLARGPSSTIQRHLFGSFVGWLVRRRTLDEPPASPCGRDNVNALVEQIRRLVPACADDAYSVGNSTVNALGQSNTAFRRFYHDYAIEINLMMCRQIREAFRGPGDVTLRPDWRTDTVLTLARSIGTSRDFTAMPILADALQDAGCDDAELLDHCRSGGLHTPGCWALDAIGAGAAGVTAPVL